MFHGLNNVFMKAQLRAVDRTVRREIAVVYECVAKFRMGSYCFEELRKLHFLYDGIPLDHGIYLKT